MIPATIKELLDLKVQQYNTPSYIETDPIQIPHSFTQKENIEISAFLTASIAWGNRKIIISNAKKLMKILDNSPFSFITQASEKELQCCDKFVHRTFNTNDLLFFIRSLRNIYNNHGGLQTVFETSYSNSGDVKQSLILFRKLFIENNSETRSLKHIADVNKNSSAKRLNMFLRWMVRRDSQGVDFGLWTGIPMQALYIPLDVHVGNIARGIEILKRSQNDWKAVEELTSILRTLDPNDPVKYDYALFGMGVFEKNQKKL